MARIEEDRDDLYAELVTANPRWELELEGSPTPLITGIRPNGVWSVYFHADRCYHFDANGGLRRAYVEGALYRSEGNTLARLIRQRTDEETTLLRHDLSSAELDDFLAIMRGHLTDLLQTLRLGTFRILRPEQDAANPALLIELGEQVLSGTNLLSPPLK